MSCVYYYKGQKFDSETALNNFILLKYTYMELFKDLVFSLSDEQLQVRASLAALGRKYEAIHQKHMEWLNAGKAKFDELGEEILDIKPYLGVNSYLNSFRDEHGERLFPEFIEEEYWKRRWNDWKNGKFNKVEIEVFGLDPTATTHPPITESDLDSSGKPLREVYRDKITAKWKVLGYIGNTVHNILELCFGYNGYNASTNEPLTHLIKSDSELKLYILDNIQSKNKEYLSADVIDDTIKYARLLHAALTAKFDGPLMFYPEFGVTETTADPDKPTLLLGIIDLLIIDKHGVAHILDYKTSIHSYAEFSGPKLLAYQYLMATYLRMLQKQGIPTRGSQLMVAPIKITGFRKGGDSDDEWEYDSISNYGNFDVLNPTMTNDRMWENLDSFLPRPTAPAAIPTNILTNVSDIMKVWLPTYLLDKANDISSITEMLKKRKLLTKNKEGNFVYALPGKTPDIVSNSESEFVQKVLEHFLKMGPRRINRTESLKAALKDTVVNGIDPTLYPQAYSSNIDTTGSTTWLTDSLAKYGDGNWEVADMPQLEEYGIIMLQTKDITGVARLIDLIRVSSKTLDLDYRGIPKGSSLLRGRQALTAAFAPDIVETSKSDSKILQATNGNVELIETMLVLNQIENIEDFPIGSITVVNPDLGNGMTASNEELLYNFNALNKYKAVAKNNFKEGKIKMASKFEILRQDFNHIMNAAAEHGFKNDYRQLTHLSDYRDSLDSVVNGSVEDKLEALSKLLLAILNNKALAARVARILNSTADLQNQYTRLYNDILLAMAQLKGIDFRLQIEDHDLWLASTYVLTEGFEGTYFDNPGNHRSDTLNAIAKLVTEAYLNTRDDLLRQRSEIFKKVQALRKLYGYDSVSATYKNQVNMYKNMWYFTPDNKDMLFVNPDAPGVSLRKEERDFLELALKLINKSRWPALSPDELEAMRRNNDPRYWRVPLTRGGDDSMATTTGLLGRLKARLKYLMLPSLAVLKAREVAEGIFNPDLESERKRSNGELFKMTNMFRLDQDPELRTKYLAKRKANQFEVEENLEALLYKHLFAHSVERNMNGVFPMIRAAVTHMSLLGAVLNKQFIKDLNYAEEYIRNKILNESIIDANKLNLAAVLSQGRNLVSTAVLAMSPVQAIYLPLQGLWQDISLMIRKPDGKQSFTREHFSKALKMAYSDLAVFSEEPTLCSLFNETYGLNDMDMNQYSERLSSSKRGIWNLHNLLFKFASRPDYYNRLTIWLCLLLGDGCLEAHSVEDGLLKYDWTKDKRFEAFANDRTSDPKYAELKSLYFAMALLFVAEHAKNPDGKPFEFDPLKKNPLPRAYTNKEAEGMKSLADDIYGYYSHEKKSLVLSTFIGSLWLQFKTFWSGKKNQYLLSGGVRLRGEWVLYSENIPKRLPNGDLELDENGNPLFELNEDGTYKLLKYYYQTDEAGNILFNEPPITDSDPKFDANHAVPFMQWKGRWLEGIVLTFSDLFRQAWDKGSFIQGCKAKWNDPDPMMRQIYQSNIKLAAYDVTMLLVIGSLLGGLLGDWLDDIQKEQKLSPTLGGAILADVVGTLQKSVKSSAMDLNAYDSVINPLTTWDPVMFTWSASLLKNIANAATGDAKFSDAVIKTNALTKSGRNTLNYIIYQSEN